MMLGEGVPRPVRGRLSAKGATRLQPNGSPRRQWVRPGGHDAPTSQLTHGAGGVFPRRRQASDGSTLWIEVTHGLRSGVVANVPAIGCIGKIIVATRGAAGPGEVLV